MSLITLAFKVALAGAQTRPVDGVTLRLPGLEVMPALSMTAEVGKHRMEWLVFCTWSRCLLRSRSEAHTSLGGSPRPSLEPGGEFYGASAVHPLHL